MASFYAWIFFFSLVSGLQTLILEQGNQNLTTLPLICEKTVSQDGLPGTCMIHSQHHTSLQPFWRTNSSSKLKNVIN